MPPLRPSLCKFTYLISNCAEKYYNVYGEMILLAIALIHDTSHAKGKASTDKPTSLGSLVGLDLILYCVLISSF